VTISENDYVIGIRTSDGETAALKAVPLVSGEYCVKARTADGQHVAMGLRSLKASGKSGIVARTADGEKVGLCSASTPACVWVLDLSGNLIETYDTGADAVAVCSDGSSVFVASGTKIYAYGTQTWELNLNLQIYAMDIDSSGNLFAGTAANASHESLFKVSNAGSVTVSKVPAVAQGTSYPDATLSVRVMANDHVAITTSETIYGRVSVVFNNGLSAMITFPWPEPGQPDHVIDGGWTLGVGNQSKGCFEEYGYWWGSWGTSTPDDQYQYVAIGGNADFFFGMETASAIGPEAIYISDFFWIAGVNGIAMFDGSLTVEIDRGMLGILTLTLPNWHHVFASMADLVVDGSSNGYAVGAREGLKSVWSYAGASGSLRWSYDTGGGTNGCRLHGSNLYVAGTRVE
jgi:hypothetical protein